MATDVLLIVDDNQADAHLIQLLLEEVAAGKFDTKVHRNLEGALGVIDQVDIVILDLFLPDSQGLNTLMAVRAAAPQVPVVVVTGLEDRDAAQKAMFYGAQAYLVKGTFDSHILLDAISRATVRQAQIILTQALRQIERDLQRTMGVMKKVSEL